MSKDFYTLLIIPNIKKSVRKIIISSTHINAASVFFIMIALFGVYFFFDYIYIKVEKAELVRLRTQTREQSKQIEGLVEKINDFTVKMNELKQFDKKIRIMANLEGNREKEQLLGIGGPMTEESLIISKMDGDRAKLIDSMNKNIEQLSRDATIQEKSFNELIQFLKEQKSILAAKPSIWPVLGWVTSEFGYRTSPFNRSREFHKGIDISSRINKEILAPADGIVSDVSYHHDEGNIVMVNHGYGISTAYGHLLKSAVNQGSMIRRGHVIGYIGNTGRSTGPHLHYSVYLNGVAVNPRRYLN